MTLAEKIATLRARADANVDMQPDTQHLVIDLIEALLAEREAQPGSWAAADAAIARLCDAAQTEIRHERETQP